MNRKLGEHSKSVFEAAPDLHSDSRIPERRWLLRTWIEANMQLQELDSAEGNGSPVGLFDLCIDLTLSDSCESST